MNGLWLASYVALWILFFIVALVLLSVLRNLGVIYESIQGFAGLGQAPTKLLPEQELPELILYSWSGEERDLSGFYGTKTSVSIVSLSCPSCLEFLKAIAEGSTPPDPLDETVEQRVIVSVGTAEETKELMSKAGLDEDIPVLLDTKNHVETAWGITSTPATVVVDENWRVVRQLFGGYHVHG